MLSIFRSARNAKKSSKKPVPNRTVLGVEKARGSAYTRERFLDRGRSWFVEHRRQLEPRCTPGTPTRLSSTQCTRNKTAHGCGDAHVGGLKLDGYTGTISLQKQLHVDVLT